MAISRDMFYFKSASLEQGEAQSLICQTLPNFVGLLEMLLL